MVSLLRSEFANKEKHIDELNTWGYTVVHNVLNPDVVSQARAALNRIFLIEKKIAPELDSSRHQISFCLAHKDRIFRSICQTPNSIDLVRSILGDDCILSVLNGISMKPRGEQQQLHIDQKGPAGQVEFLSTLFPLDQFTRENGCTRLIPGSHKILHSIDTPADHTSNQFDHLEEKAIYLEIPAGSMIVYNGLILHAGSRNMTGEPRRALIASYCRSWIKPQWNFFKSMPRHVWADFTLEERALFGDNAFQPLLYDHKTAYIYSPSRLTRKLEGARRKADKLLNTLLKRNPPFGGSLD